jgi:hypothetical protein
LLYSALVVPGLSEHAILEHSELVRADDQGVSRIDSNSLGFLAREVTCQDGWFQVAGIALIDLGIDRFIVVEETVKQLSPVL